MATNVIFYRLESTGPSNALQNEIRTRGTVIAGDVIRLRVTRLGSGGRAIPQIFESACWGVDVRGQGWLLRREGDNIEGLHFNKDTLTKVQPHVVDLTTWNQNRPATRCILWSSKHLFWMVENGTSPMSQLYVDGYVQTPANGEPFFRTTCDRPRSGIQSIPVDVDTFETQVYRVNNNEEARRFIQRFPDKYHALVLSRLFFIQPGWDENRRALPNILVCEKSICTDNPARGFRPIEPIQTHLDAVAETPVACPPTGARYASIAPFDRKKC